MSPLRRFATVKLQRRDPIQSLRYVVAGVITRMEAQDEPPDMAVVASWAITLRGALLVSGLEQPPPSVTAPVAISDAAPLRPRVAPDQGDRNRAGSVTP